jgi:hypothetical protein
MAAKEVMAKANVNGMKKKKRNQSEKRHQKAKNEMAKGGGEENGVAINGEKRGKASKNQKK